MDEKVFVGYSYGSFETDDKRQQEYCNVFMLEDFTGDQNDRYHFSGHKAVKYKCADTAVFSGISIGTIVRCYFDGKGKLVLMKPVDSAKKAYVTPTGNLVVSCVNSSGASSDTFTYTVTLGSTSISGTYGGMTFTNGVASFSLTGGNSKTASGLPAGTTYTVTQASKANYTVTSSGTTGTITKGASKTASFTNTYSAPSPSTGTLVISVVNDGGSAEQAFDYTITLGDASVSGLYGDVNFNSGVGNVSILSGSSVTIPGLPVTSYMVSQNENTSYTTTSESAAGTIVAGGSVTATFTNTIIQDSEKPSRVVDHPILAVKTQIPVANYQIGGVRPAYPTTGLVWALVEKGYITSIQIYTGYAWEAVDARIWTGSRWIPYNFFNVITLNDMYDVVDASGNQGNPCQVDRGINASPKCRTTIQIGQENKKI